MALGLVSRWVDTAAWAPDWIGLVFSPWLAAAWLAGSFAATVRAGAWRGLALSAGTVAAYLLAVLWGDGGAEAARLAPLLIPFVLLSGLLWSAAGAAWRIRGAWARASGALLGATVFVEGLILQLGDRLLVERTLFAGESLAGLLLSIWLIAPGEPRDDRPVIGAKRRPGFRPDRHH